MSTGQYIAMLRYWVVALATNQMLLSNLLQQHWKENPEHLYCLMVVKWVLWWLERKPKTFGLPHGGQVGLGCEQIVYTSAQAVMRSFLALSVHLMNNKKGNSQDNTWSSKDSNPVFVLVEVVQHVIWWGKHGGDDVIITKKCKTWGDSMIPSQTLLYGGSWVAKVDLFQYKMWATTGSNPWVMRWEPGLGKPMIVWTPMMMVRWLLEKP